MSVAALLDRALRAARAEEGFGRVLVAVSGGSDSLALLHLVHDWAALAEVEVAAVTVDHGLRPESAGEAAQVGAICAGLGVVHEILRWQGWDGQGNLQSAARTARYDLIAGAVPGLGPPSLIVLGHTRDDLAETFLMRLARGSGVDGLAAMRAGWRDRGQRWARPLLGARRQALRDWLTARGVRWVDDPSNDDPRFDRVKARQALAALAPLGLGVDRLADTADALRDARLALEAAAQEAAKGLARVEAGDVVFDRPRLLALVPEIRDRLLAQALIWVGGGPYRPRRDSLRALAHIEAPRATLAGCLVSRRGDHLRVGREPVAVEALTVPSDRLWDRRWRLDGPHRAGYQIAALGEAGLALCPAWRDSGLPRASLLASPAIWDSARGGGLVAAPLARAEPRWSAKIDHPAGDFFTSVLSH